MNSLSITSQLKGNPSRYSLTIHSLPSKMAGRYIPPHLRNKQLGSPQDNATPASQASLPPARRISSDEECLSVKDIQAYFCGNDSSADTRHSTTLHSSADNPDGLAWVLLFDGANPKWESDGVIFVKSNLDLLPAIKAPPEASRVHEHAARGGEAKDGEAKKREVKEGEVENVQDKADKVDGSDLEEDGGCNTNLTDPTSQEILDPAINPPTGETAKENVPPVAGTCSTPTKGVPEAHPPIAVFRQLHGVRSWRSFQFLGWYTIMQLELLAPHSEGLVRMLSRKWETVDRYGRVQQRRRDAGAWEASMAHRWAVVNMERDEQAMKEKGEPKIERTEDEGFGGEAGARKSVNEMLAELRMK